MKEDKSLQLRRAKENIRSPMRLLAMVVVLATGFGIIGCVRTPVQIVERDPSFVDDAYLNRMHAREGKACRSLLFYLIPIGNNSLEAAMKDLFTGQVEEPGVITVETLNSIWLIGSSHCTVVTAYPSRAFKPKSVKQLPPEIQAQQPAEPVAEAPLEEPEKERDEATEDSEYSGSAD